jgi:hypothetical protein
MYILRIEHAVADFDGWKKAFDADPAGRRKSGVHGYQIMRPVDDPNYVMIDLSFNTAKEAEALLAALRTLWGQAKGSILAQEPRTRIVEQVENTTL